MDKLILPSFFMRRLLICVNGDIWIREEGQPHSESVRTGFSMKQARMGTVVYPTAALQHSSLEDVFSSYRLKMLKNRYVLERKNDSLLFEKAFLDAFESLYKSGNKGDEK